MDHNNNGSGSGSGSVLEARKKTKGRVKIPLDQKIQKKANLQVTFSKRRQGLFKKASQICVLTGADIAILVRSPAGKIFAFGSPSADAVIGRFEGSAATSNCLSEWQNVEQVEGRRRYDEAARELEMLKKDGWWDQPFEAMDLQELENFAMSLEILGAQFN